ncbi:hypothetical protein NBRC111894_3981 [Sporolactobacillus inulinus]|uniref:Uncharacterized protein n=1 Tax=Sporolactobacillus inulinus TaxID=2078 RepID=A0A4Y1ZGZ1_9BACL|nr:hypothetical protein NBRC111894_3981 [Sporolactobacillus inulinus]
MPAEVQAKGDPADSCLSEEAPGLPAASEQSERAQKPKPTLRAKGTSANLKELPLFVRELSLKACTSCAQRGSHHIL